MSASLLPPNAPQQNHLLAALSVADLKALMPHLQLTLLPLGEILYEPGDQLQHAYFPTTAIVSLHYVMASGATTEAAGVGHEGVVGVSLFMGGDTTSSSAVVQTAGYAYRLARNTLLRLTFTHDLWSLVDYEELGALDPLAADGVERAARLLGLDDPRRIASA